MGLGSTISRSLSIAGSYNESSYGSSSASSTAPKNRRGHSVSVASKDPKTSVMRASTVTSATTMSKLIRSASTASTSCESIPASLGSTLRPPTTASRSCRASTVTSGTSMSNFIRSDSSASSTRPPATAPTASTTSLSRSSSKYAPAYFSTAASRFLWGRRPPGHSSLQPSQIAGLTQTLSLPSDTSMLSSLIGALGVPLSRSQYSPTPSCFCDTHFWFEQKYIEELTEVISHEIGAQLDKLRIAPVYLISKKTQRVLSILEPYKDIYAGIDITHSSSSFTSSNSSTNPTCAACNLSHFFQNPNAVKALTTCVKGRKHRNRPWPCSMAWLEPNPGKGIDWEAKWKAEGKTIGRDRIRVQHWRRQSRRDEQEEQEQELPEQQQQQALGHAPGQGCDFCDHLRLERADEEDLDAVIAEEEEEEDEYDEGRTLNSVAEETETLDHHHHEEDSSETLRDSSFSDDDSETYRAKKEESIIRQYQRSSESKSKADSLYSYGYGRDNQQQQKENNDKKRASQWARSYTRLVEPM